LVGIEAKKKKKKKKIVGKGLLKPSQGASKIIAYGIHTLGDIGTGQGLRQHLRFVIDWSKKMEMESSHCESIGNPIRSGTVTQYGDLRPGGRRSDRNTTTAANRVASHNPFVEKRGNASPLLWRTRAGR
jgi:hypothetical protein